MGDEAMFVITTVCGNGAVSQPCRSTYEAALFLGRNMVIADGEAWRRLSGRLVALPPGCRFAGPGKGGEWITVERLRNKADRFPGMV